MYNLVWDKHFARNLKKFLKYNPELEETLKERLDLLSSDPFAQSLKTHKLTGKLSGIYAFSINYKYRLLFDIPDSNNLLLIDIGSHDEVY